jgi:deoxycytidine triphosphate deaminase
MKHIASQSSKSNLSAVQPQDIQPNAVDLRLGKIFQIKSREFIIDETQKVHRGSVPIDVRSDGYYHLEPGCYEVIMENEIEVAEGEAGWVITRSTLNRNGVFLTSGLYDSGYQGVMAGVMHVNGGMMKIRPGTRIGQYLTFDAETIRMYDGDYGVGKAHDTKYV